MDVALLMTECLQLCVNDNELSGIMYVELLQSVEYPSHGEIPMVSGH